MSPEDPEKVSAIFGTTKVGGPFPSLSSYPWTTCSDGSGRHATPTAPPTVYERGYPDAAYMLGVLHDDAGDYHAAFRFYNEAHSKDCVKATFALGVMYEIGRGTQRHYGKAFQFYEEALRGGDGGEWSAEAPPGLS